MRRGYVVLMRWMVIYGYGVPGGALTLSQLKLHICRVSKTFGEWYQKTHKTEDTNKLTLLVSKIIYILHNKTVGNPTKSESNSVIYS
jgi:hypothetical protein